MLPEQPIQDEAFKRATQLREAWLLTAFAHLQPLLASKDIAIDGSIRISVGFPSRRCTYAGECWPRNRAKDGANHIFITPSIDDPIEVLAIALHEVLHAADDCVSGHRGRFRRMALAVGLTGRMTRSVPSPALRAHLTTIAANIGPYPHGALQHRTTAESQPAGSRLLKALCPSCGYVIRVTRVWVGLKGLPTCPCGRRFVLQE